jgi:phenylacetate-CoA ligase
LNTTLTIVLERRHDASRRLADQQVREAPFTGLVRVNQDFREVSKMFTEEKLLIEQHDYGQGPFTSRAIRVKNQYVALPSAGAALTS